MMVCYRLIRLVLLNIIISLAILTAGLTWAGPTKIIWRLQSIWPVGSAMYPALVRMCNNINSRAGGRLEVKLFVPGEIVGTLDVMDALRHNVIEMAATSGIYNSARVPEGLIEFGLPFGLETPDQLEAFWYRYKNGRNFNLLREAYREKGVEILSISAGTSYGYMTKFPVNGIDDFKGKKIRSFGFFGAVVALMGAVPVSLATEDQYLALQEGTVDGTIFPYLSMETMKFKDVLKYIVVPPALGAPSSDIIAAGQAFDRLPEDLQQIVLQEARTQNRIYLSVECPQESEMISNPAKHGLEINTLPPEQVEELRQKCQTIWNRVGARNSRTRVLVSDLQEFLSEQKAAGKVHGY